MTELASAGDCRPKPNGVLSTMLHDPHIWNLEKGHPYIKGLQDQFADEPSSKACEEGKSIELITEISDLYEEVIAGGF